MGHTSVTTTEQVYARVLPEAHEQMDNQRHVPKRFKVGELLLSNNLRLQHNKDGPRLHVGGRVSTRPWL